MLYKMDFAECVDWVIDWWVDAITYMVLNDDIDDLLFKRACQDYELRYNDVWKVF